MKCIPWNCSLTSTLILGLKSVRNIKLVEIVQFIHHYWKETQLNIARKIKMQTY